MRLAIGAVALTAVVVTAAAFAAGSGSGAREIKVVEHATADA
jgi:phage tail tape-measure protein